MVKLKQPRERLVGQGERLERLGGRARLAEARRRAERGRGLADAPAHGGARLGGGDARVAAHGRERPGAGADRRRRRGHVGRARRRQAPGLVPELADARPRRGPEDIIRGLARFGREPRREERRRRPALRLWWSRRPVAVAAALRLDASSNTCAGKRTVSTYSRRDSNPQSSP